MAQEELQESKLTKAGGRKPTHGCNYPMVGWPSVILTPVGPSLNLTREGTSRPSLRSSLSLYATALREHWWSVLAESPVFAVIFNYYYCHFIYQTRQALAISCTSGLMVGVPYVCPHKCWHRCCCITCSHFVPRACAMVCIGDA